MDMIHANFTLAGAPRELNAWASVRRILQEYLEYSSAGTAKRLVLIARPDHGQTIFLDQMVRIEAARDRSFPAARVSQLVSILKHAIRGVKNFAYRPMDENGAIGLDSSKTDCGNHEDMQGRNSIQQLLPTTEFPDIESPALAASLQLRNWVMAD